MSVSKSSKQKLREAKERRKKARLEKKSAGTIEPPLTKSSHENKANYHAGQKPDNHPASKSTANGNAKRTITMSGWISNISILACAILFCGFFGFWFLRGFDNVKSGFFWLIPACVALVVAILSSYWYYVVKPAKTISNAIGLRQPSFHPGADKIAIKVGTDAVSWSVATLKEQRKVPIAFGDYEPIHVYVENDTLFVDASIVIPGTQQQFEIKRNNYDAIPTGCDLNATPNAIEIVDRNLVPLFQIIFRSNSDIAVNGVFQQSNGAIWIVDETGTHTGNRPYRLKRLFRYPAYQHPGEYEQQSPN